MAAAGYAGVISYLAFHEAREINRTAAPVVATYLPVEERRPGPATLKLIAEEIEEWPALFWHGRLMGKRPDGEAQVRRHTRTLDRDNG